MSSNRDLRRHTATAHIDNSDSPIPPTFILPELGARHIDRRDRLAFNPLLHQGGEQPVTLNDDSVPDLVSNVVDK
jgi:hypothetical protein